MAGSYQVVVGANDGNSGAAQGFTLQAKTITPPIIQSTTPPTTAIPNTLYRYDIIAFDPQGRVLTLMRFTHFLFIQFWCHHR